MKGAKRRPPKMKVIQSRERAQALFEGWRKKLTNLEIELKRPRGIDAVPVDFLRDEVPERGMTVVPRPFQSFGAIRS